MNTTIYIRECINEEEMHNGKLPKFINKILLKIKRKVNLIIRKKVENIITYIVPDINNKNLLKRMQSKLKKEENPQIVLSNKIKNLGIEINNVKIIDGKIAQKHLVKETLDYIVNTIKDEEIKLEFLDIYILQKEHSTETVSMVEYLSNKVKTINIVTNAINKYRKLEEDLYNKGYLITISNNKKKSLKKAKIILNINFSNEELANYAINRNSIIINFTNNKIENLKGFDGIIINQIEIEISEELKQYFKENNIYEGYNKIELYESIYGKEKFIKEQRKIEENRVKVVKLIGNNGKIAEKELILKKMFLTNAKN